MKKLRGGLQGPLFYQRIVFVSCTLLLQITLTSISAYASSPISGFNPSKIDAEAIDTSINITTFWADNALTLQSILFNRWGGSFTPAKVNHGDAYWYTDTDFTYKGWRVAIFNRGELFMEANRDAVQILHMIKTDQDLPVGRRFNVDIKAEGFSATGVELSNKIDLGSLVQGLNIGFSMRYLDADRIQHGTLQGIFTPTGPKTYDFNLAVDYVYDKNLLYKRENSSPESGNGYSFDIGTTYNWQNNLEISVLARDVLGYIYWKEAPYTTAEATSDVKYFNSEGYQSFRPTIEGYEAYKDFTQKIPMKTDVDVTYMEGPVKLCGTVNFIELRPFYWLNMEYVPKEPLTLIAGYDINYGVYSVGVAYKQLQLKAYADSFSFGRAKALGLTLSCGIKW